MADSTWGTTEVKMALPEITPAAGRPINEDALKIARDAGWVQPIAHNYSSTAPASTRDREEAAPKPETAAEGEGAEDAPLRRQGTSTWAHDAAKYEWKEEYGDIGPTDPTLEKELFQGEHITRTGAKIEKYVHLLTSSSVLTDTL